MESLKEIYAGLNLERILQKRKENRTPDTCLRCDAPLEWKGTIQYRNVCPNCGNVVISHGRMPEKEVECWICYDTGICEYEAQFDDQMTVLVAACVCYRGKYFESQPNEHWQGFPKVTNARCAPPPEVLARRNKEKSTWKKEG